MVKMLKKLGRNPLLSVRFLRILRSKYTLYIAPGAVLLIFFIIFGGRGLVQIYHLKEERTRVEAVNSRLGAENRKLAEQIERMKHNKEEIEKIAREELGLVKKGEVIYQFER